MKHIITQEDIDTNKFGSEVEVGHEVEIEEVVKEETVEDNTDTESSK